MLFRAVALGLVLISISTNCRAGDAASIRSEKRIDLLAIPVGFAFQGPFADFYSFDPGVAVGLHLTRDAQVLIETGSEAFNTSTQYAGHQSIKGKYYGAHLKYFLSEYLFAKAGVDQRSIQFQFKNNSSIGDLEGSTKSFTLAIGTQAYYASDFTLGWEIAYSRPIASTVEVETNSTNDEWTGQRLKAAKKATLEFDSYYSVRGYFGFSF